jgi:hypothetical protein
LVLVSVVGGNKVVVVASENNAVEKHVGEDRRLRTSDRTDDNPRTPGCAAMKRSIRTRAFIVCILSTTIGGNLRIQTMGRNNRNIIEYGTNVFLVR